MNTIIHKERIKSNVFTEIYNTFRELPVILNTEYPLHLLHSYQPFLAFNPHTNFGDF